MTECPLQCKTECKAELHGCASECQSLKTRRAIASRATPADQEPVTPKYELVNSIIHKCPAIKVPQSFLQKLGMTAQIIPLKGMAREDAKFVVKALNGEIK